MVTIQQYTEIAVRGIEATQDNRGGYVFQGFFYYPAATNMGIFQVPARDWVPSVDLNSGNGRLG